MSSKEFNILMKRLDRIEAKISPDTKSKWLSEVEVMLITGLGKRQLHRKRKTGVFAWSTATGRKIKYLKRDVDNYLNDNASIVKI